MSQITVVGGGLAGLTAAIACAEGGAKVRLLEAHEQLGGRARSADGPYKANLGPHALYSDGAMWGWLNERGLLPNHVRPPLGGARFRWGASVQRTPPLGTIPAVLRLRGRQAPVDTDFRSWVAAHTDERIAAMLSSMAGVYTFHHDPGELSAAFVWERTVRLFLSTPPPSTVVRYASGGWSGMVAPLERRLRELGVEVQTGSRVESLPEAPVILATELHQASELLGGEPLQWPSGRTVCLDVGLSRRRGDPWIVSDLDESGWIGRYSSSDRHDRPGGSRADPDADADPPRREHRSGGRAPGAADRPVGRGLARARDLAPPAGDGRALGRARPARAAPGATAPPVDRGDGVYLAGDMVAAPGLLAEVSWASGLGGQPAGARRGGAARVRSCGRVA